MSGARHFAKHYERQRNAGLREQRAYEREQRLDLQDVQVSDVTHKPERVTVCACGAPSFACGFCADCFLELGGES